MFARPLRSHWCLERRLSTPARSSRQCCWRVGLLLVPWTTW